jgi:FK506-binding protein 14
MELLRVPRMANSSCSRAWQLLLLCVVSVRAGVEVSVESGPTLCHSDELISYNSIVTVHYTAVIDESSEAGEPGKIVGSTRAGAYGGRGKPLSYLSGHGHILKGWDVGLTGLCQGARATLLITPELAYAAADQAQVDGVPAQATLKFDVEVLGVRQPEMFEQIDSNRDGRFDPDELRAYFIGQNLHDNNAPVSDMFHLLDKDRDGFVSWKEFDGPKGKEAPKPLSTTLKDEL